MRFCKQPSAVVLSAAGTPAIGASSHLRLHTWVIRRRIVLVVLLFDMAGVAPTYATTLRLDQVPSWVFTPLIHCCLVPSDRKRDPAFGQVVNECR